VDCGYPGTIPHAEEIQVKDGTKYGAVAKVVCKDGFWVDHVFSLSITLNCTSDGLWEPPPEDVYCVSKYFTHQVF